MPQDGGGNVYAFAVPHHGGPWVEARGATAAEDRVDGMRAMLSQLEYLHGEALRLNARTSAHLIGAAVQAVRRELAEAPREA
jgi:hypothetical protein